MKDWKGSKYFGVLLVLLLMGMVPFAQSGDASPAKKSTALMSNTDWYGSVDTDIIEDTSGDVSSSGYEYEYDSNGKPIITPYWMDLVNAESKDVSVEDDQKVYVAVLDTGLIPAYASVLPTGKLDLMHAKAFTVDWTWDDDLDDYIEGDVYVKTKALFNPGWPGYYTEAWGKGHGTAVTSVITGFYRTMPDFSTDPWTYKTYYVRGVSENAVVIPVLVLDSWLLSCPDSSYPGCYGGKYL